MKKCYTEEQDNWLKQNYPKYNDKQVAILFNKQFNTSFSPVALHSHSIKKLKLKKQTKNHFTEEMKSWIYKNYPVDESREDTYNRFVSIFGNSINLGTFTCFCKRNKIQKPKHRWNFQNGNKTWTTGLSKEEHRSHFTSTSFQSMTSTSNVNFPHIRDRILYGVSDPSIVISDLGNGEKIFIPYKIYKLMSWNKILHQGDLTSTQFLIYTVKKQIEDISGKPIRIGML